MKRVYLDACCLNRPFDDQSQDRIRLEAEAVVLILRRIESGHWQGIGSEVLDYETEQTPDPDRRARVRQLLALAQTSVAADDAVASRAQELESRGLRAFDALHVACAEGASADVFLTTDDKLLRRAAGMSAELRVRVANPVVWLSEVLANEQSSDDA